MRFNWERSAYKNLPCPKSITELHEILAYQAMCLLFARFKDGKIEKEAAQKEKDAIVSAFQQNEQQMQELQARREQQLEFLHKAEQAVIRFNGATTLEDKVEAAEDFIAYTYNCGTRVGRHAHLVQEMQAAQETASSDEAH